MSGEDVSSAWSAWQRRHLRISDRLQEAMERQSILIDTHDHPVCHDVWRLYERAVRRVGAVSTLVEFHEIFARRVGEQGRSAFEGASTNDIESAYALHGTVLAKFGHILDF